MNGQRYDIPLGVSVPNINLNVSKNAIPISVSESIVTVEGDAYDGDYEVTPKFEPQTLLTDGKVMLDDVLVHEIKVVRTSNPYGGQTVVIG